VLLNDFGLNTDGSLVIAAGRPWDIFFLVAEVVAGAYVGHFSERLQSPSRAYRDVGLFCAKAILARGLGRRSPRFAVARIGNHVAAAILFSESDDPDLQRVLTIKYLVVSAHSRRHGVGAALVDYARSHAPEGGVECYCTPPSRGMQRLLKRLGFVRTHRSEVIGVDEPKAIMPARWHWQRRPVKSQSQQP